MAHREEVAWLGSYHDTAFGIDDEGEVFYTLADAKAALSARHRGQGEEEQGSYATRPNGHNEWLSFTMVTNDAYILLWQLDVSDQIYPGILEIRHRNGEETIDAKRYFPNHADRVVWVGARQAIRVGSLAEFEEQRALRNRQDVREAGSVVVTDA